MVAERSPDRRHDGVVDLALAGDGVAEAQDRELVAGEGVLERDATDQRGVLQAAATPASAAATRWAPTQ